MKNIKKNKKKHVKLGDRVQVISGAQKGIIGTITLIQTKEQKVVIDNVPTRSKMVKGREGEESKKVDLPILIHTSNVMLWDDISNLPSRIGYKQVEGKKRRYFKKSGNLI